jgi:hypothetical protein
VANTTDTEVIILSSSSSSSDAAAPQSAAATGDPQPAATAAAGEGGVSMQRAMTPPWRRRGYSSTVGSALSTARLQGRASAGAAWWLAGMSGGCEIVRRSGQMVLVAPMMACWVSGGKMGGRGEGEGCMLC